MNTSYSYECNEQDVQKMAVIARPCLCPVSLFFLVPKQDGKKTKYVQPARPRCSAYQPTNPAYDACEALLCIELQKWLSPNSLFWVFVYL